MRSKLAALAVLLLAAPATAQPFILRVEPERQQAPQPSPVPVAPPQAEATPEAGLPRGDQPAATGSAASGAGVNGASGAGSNGAGVPQDGAEPQPAAR